MSANLITQLSVTKKLAPESDKSLKFSTEMDYPELLTPRSLSMPPARMNNFWYVRRNSETVVVFIHGIFSDSRGCWLFQDSKRTRLVFWPDLVREDDRFGNPSIYLAGFYTAVDAGDFSIAQCARDVLEALERPESDRKLPVLEYKNLVFVCHSTGGIVARYMLERNKELFSQKGVGLALIASPSLGSVWANVANLAARYYNQRLALQLQWGGDALEDIHERFRDLVDQRSKVMPGLFGMEACESKMILRDKGPTWVRWFLPNRLKVVNTLSAGQYFGAVKVLADTDHFSAVKPDTPEHPSHQFLVTFFQRFQQFLAERSVEQPRGAEPKRGSAMVVANTQLGAESRPQPTPTPVAGSIEISRRETGGAAVPQTEAILSAIRRAEYAGVVDHDDAQALRTCIDDLELVELEMLELLDNPGIWLVRHGVELASREVKTWLDLLQAAVPGLNGQVRSCERHIKRLQARGLLSQQGQFRAGEEWRKWRFTTGRGQMLVRVLQRFEDKD